MASSHSLLLCHCQCIDCLCLQVQILSFWWELMGSLLFLASLHPTTLYWAVGRQTENGPLPCNKCAEMKFEVWSIQDLGNFGFFNYCFYSNGLNLFLQNRWSTMWFTVVCVVFMRESYASKQREARQDLLSFLYMGKGCPRKEREWWFL